MDINNRPTGSEIPRGYGWGSEEGGIYLGWGGIVTIPKKSTLDKEGEETKGFKDMNGGTKSGTMKTEGEEFMLFCPTPTAFVPGL